jgi:hypothetical protein
MEKNVGGYDRIARLVVGPVLVLVGVAGAAGFLSLAVFGISTLVVGVLALLVGAILTVTGVTQKCPLNSVLGFDTYRPSASREEPGERHA